MYIKWYIKLCSGIKNDRVKFFYIVCYFKSNNYLYIKKKMNFKKRSMLDKYICEIVR